MQSEQEKHELRTHLFERIFDAQLPKIQTSVSLSSMEAEIPAATSLLTEAIYVKQVLQFLVNDMGGLGSQRCVEMRLRLDSTNTQTFFTRLEPGRAKHLSTKLL
jgi:hypothetical protein